jgi:uncharacterized protein (TIGR03000 family)
VEGAQAQLRSRLSGWRESRLERRDARRGIVRNQTGMTGTTTGTTMTGQPRMTGGTVYTYKGEGYETRSSVSYYFNPNAQPSSTTPVPANVRVILPDAKARIFIDGVATEQSGLDRLFVTPNLQPGTYNYVLRVTYMVNNQERSHERTIQVTPGRTTVLDLTQR